MGRKPRKKDVGNKDHVDFEYRELVAHGSNEFPIEVKDYVADPYKEYGMHWHDEMEIVYVREGAIYFLINQNETIHACKGDLVVIPPGAKHSLWSDESTGVVLSIVSMLFNPKMLNTEMPDICQRVLTPIIDSSMAFRFLIKNGCERYEAIKAIYFAIYDCYMQDNAFSLVRIKGKLYELMYELLQLEVLTGKPKDKNSAIMAKTYEYIQLNYMYKLNVTELCKLFNYCETYFMRLFKEHFGTTFSKYVNTVRLEKAKDLVKTTNFSVDRIAREVGFSSTGYLIRLFKKEYNESPGQMRDEKLAQRE